MACKLLRRGIDQISLATGTPTSALRHAQYVENDQVVSTTTASMKSVTLPITIKIQQVLTFHLH
jgi:hypothetical protein